MVDQREQDGGGRAPAERPDKGPVIRAGLALPAAIAGGDTRGVVEKMRGCGQHSRISRHGEERRAEAIHLSFAWRDGLLRVARNDVVNVACSIAAILRNSMTHEVIASSVMARPDPAVHVVGAAEEA